VHAFPRFDLGGRTALVTAASRGPGEAISLARANAGADVALGLHDASPPAALVTGPTLLIDRGWTAR
jgi:hypothetical protein